MIAQGGDGLSCGATNEGVMSGEDFLLFLPLHRSAIERSVSLRNWIEKWGGPNELILLQPEDWFVRAHDIVGHTYSKHDPHQKEWKPII